MAAEAETIKQLIRYKLLSASAVTDLVSGRIYGGHFQDPDAQTPTYPLIILEWIGAGELQYAKAFQKMESHKRGTYGKSLDQPRDSTTRLEHTMPGVSSGAWRPLRR